jgi:hypothetical protein
MKGEKVEKIYVNTFDIYVYFYVGGKRKGVAGDGVLSDRGQKSGGRISLYFSLYRYFKIYTFTF